jgi:competence protein ComFC
MIKIIARMNKLALDTIFPPVCVNCKISIPDQKQFLCQSCFDEIRMNSALYCPKCMARLPGKNKCHDTSYILAPASRFEAPIPSLIHTFKYKKIEDIGTMLCAMLISYLKKTGVDMNRYLITFVPLHPSKLRARGFNQAKILASTVSDYFSVPCLDVLKRVKNNPPQAKTKDFTERLKNISGCFRIINPELISGKNIIVVDDVSTSGATLEEISSLLKKYGAEKIIGLVVAKA